jgi:hypothetical protein
MVQNGQLLRVRTLDGDGLLLEADGDAWPRPASIEFYPEAEATRTKLRWLQERYGWDTVTWQVGVTDGCLVLTGRVSDGLPSGYYRFRMRVAELTLPKELCQVHVEEDKGATISLAVIADARRVQLTRQPAAFDDQIRRVVEAAESKIDGRPMAQWLVDPVANAERKACVLNLLAKLRSVPTPDQPLITDVRYVFFASFERMYACVERPFFDRLFALTKDCDQPFYFEGTPASSTHLRLIDEVKDQHLEPGTAKFDLESFREQGRRCMQAVVALPTGTQSGNLYADLDIDLGNPLQDIEGVFIHCGELCDPQGLTDHLELHDPLEQQPAKDYLYYDVV